MGKSTISMAIFHSECLMLIFLCQDDACLLAALTAAEARLEFISLFWAVLPGLQHKIE